MTSLNFDSNAWYQITEERVDFNSSLQLVKSAPNSLVMAAACDQCLQYWQIVPSTFATDDASNGTYVLRNRYTDTTKQLGVCYAPKEADSSKTRPCMVNATGGDDQKWKITQWKDGALKLQNIGNGTNYNLDCHQGNPLFLSSTTVANPKQPAQHWQVSSIGVINNNVYSTAIPVCLNATVPAKPVNLTFLDFSQLSNSVALSVIIIFELFKFRTLTRSRCWNWCRCRPCWHRCHCRPCILSSSKEKGATRII